MSWTTIILIILALLFILIIIFFILVIGLTALAFVFRKKWRAMLQNIVLPDPRAIEDQLNEICTTQGIKDSAVLVKYIIDKHAGKAGLIGAATGVGGVFFDVVGLPIDAVSVLRVQASMIFLIAYASGYRHDLSEEDKLKLVLVLSGSNQVIRYVGRYVVKILLTSIPFAGAVAGYVLNYLAVKGTGELANRYFSGKLTLSELKSISLKTLSRAKLLTSQASSGSVNIAGTVSDKLKEMVHRSPPQHSSLPETKQLREKTVGEGNQEPND